MGVEASIVSMVLLKLLVEAAEEQVVRVLMMAAEVVEGLELLWKVCERQLAVEVVSILLVVVEGLLGE